MITSYFAPKKKKNPPSSTTATTATTSEGLKRERDEAADTVAATATATATTTTVSTTSRDNSSKRAKAATVSPPTVAVPKGAVASISSNDQKDATTQLLSSLTDDSWRHELADHFDKPSFRRLAAFVVAEQQSKQHVIYPPPAAIWTALNLCPLSQVKVVIVGQDPYHGPGQAHGLAYVRLFLVLPCLLLSRFTSCLTHSHTHTHAHTHTHTHTHLPLHSQCIFC
jgi:hypothetical protein